MTVTTPLFTARQAAEVLGVHRNTVKRIPPEQLPFYRIGTRGDRRYRPEDVVAYLRRNLAE